MPIVLLRSVLLVTLALALGACDRSDLGDDGPPIPSMPSPPVAASTCSAFVDGVRFSAATASASADPSGTLGFSCGSGAGGFLFSLQPESEGATTLPLGVPGNRAQYRVGEDVTVTVGLPGGEEVGEVRLTSYTSSRIVGTFRFNAPGFSQGDPLIRVTGGVFNIAVN
ncbi:MAG: DUF6252 family protein [Rhodothermales bacterium]